MRDYDGFHWKVKRFCWEKFDVYRLSRRHLGVFHAQCLSLGRSAYGFVGTYAPRAVGAVLPTINSTTVYLAIFGINLVFLACFYQCLREVVKDEELLDDLVYVFFAHRFVAGVSFLFYDPEREQFLL